jgi:hypothetical protein
MEPTALPNLGKAIIDHVSGAHVLGTRNTADDGPSCLSPISIANGFAITACAEC